MGQILYEKVSEGIGSEIVDGLDEMASEDLDTILGLFARIKEQLTIQIILTSRRSNDITDAISSLQPSEIRTLLSYILVPGQFKYKSLITFPRMPLLI